MDGFTKMKSCKSFLPCRHSLLTIVNLFLIIFNFKNSSNCAISFNWNVFTLILFDFINLIQVHNFTVIAQEIFTFCRLSVFTVSFTGILQVLMR